MQNAVHPLRSPQYGAIDIDQEKRELFLSIIGSAIPFERASDVVDMFSLRYRTTTALLTEDPRELRKIPGVCEKVVEALKGALAIHVKVLRESLFALGFGDGLATVRNYCSFLFMDKEVCVLKVFFLRNGRLLTEGELECGTLEEALFQPREIVKRALSVNANGVYLVFGRKPGNEQLSAEEDSIVAGLEKACAAVGVDFAGSMVVVTESRDQRPEICLAM